MKPILIIEEHADIKKLKEEHDQKLKFFQKKHDDLHEEIKKANKFFWIEVENYLESKKLVKGASKKELVIRSGVLYEDEKKNNSEDGFMRFIKGLIE